MRQTIYKCDRCKKEIGIFVGCGKLVFPKPKTAILFDNLFGRYSTSIHTKTYEYELCYECYKKVLNFMEEHEDE